MNFNILFKLCGAAMLVLSLNACSTMTEMGNSMMTGASQGVDAVKDIFTPSENK